MDGLCGPFQPNTSYDFKLHVFHDGKHPKALHHLKPGPLSPGLPTCESPCSRAEMKEAEPEQPGGIGPCSRSQRGALLCWHPSLPQTGGCAVQSYRKRHGSAAKPRQGVQLPALNTPGIRRGLAAERVARHTQRCLRIARSSAAGPQLRSAPTPRQRAPRMREGPSPLTCSPAAGSRRPRSSRTSAPRPVAAAPSRQAPGRLGALERQNPEPPAATAAPREKQRHEASARGGEERRTRNPRGTHRRTGLRHDSSTLDRAARRRHNNTPGREPAGIRPLSPSDQSPPLS